MNRYSLQHVPGPVLLRQLEALTSSHRDTTALVVAHIGEAEARRLHVGAGYPSMFRYCVGRLHLSEDEAFKRIRAARMARRFPAAFEMLADGRLHRTGLVTLAPWLNRENAAGLLAAATHQSRKSIERLLAERFPKPDLPAHIAVLAPAPASPQLAPEPVLAAGGELAPEPVRIAAEPCPEEIGATPGGRLAPEPVALAPERPLAASRVLPLSPGRCALQLSGPQEIVDLLEYAQALLGHAVPSGDLGEVIRRALEVYVRHLERQKFGACDRPRGAQQASANPRHIPAAVKWAVWQRDGGQCTFVSDASHRCESRTRLEFDHIEPVARGGLATVGNLRLRCRAHNQFAAEQAFGASFMHEKRALAGRAEGVAHSRAARQPEPVGPRARSTPAAEEWRARAAAAEEALPWLRAFGVRKDEARRGPPQGVEAADVP